jgi:hypothetical protein
MDSKVTIHQTLVNSSVEKFIKKNELDLSIQDAFELYTASLITKNNNSDIRDLQDAVVDGAQDGGIDTFIVFINNISITSTEDLQNDYGQNLEKIDDDSKIDIFLVQSKYEKKIKKKVFMDFRETYETMINIGSLGEDSLLKSYNSDLVEKIMLFRKIYIHCLQEKLKFNLNFFYASLYPTQKLNYDQEKSKEKLYETVIGNAPNPDLINLSVEYLSAQRLSEMNNTPKIEKIKLAFKDEYISSIYGENKTIALGLVKLNDYYDFITDSEGDIKESIFDNNIRHYQGGKNVNEDIGKNLSSISEPDFWVYNNGITIIASKCGYDHKALILTDPRIVNGLQTSFTIFHKYKINEHDQRSIVVRVIESDDSELTDSLISATNSQTALPKSAFRATDKIHRDLENFFLANNYFYDRRKNYYKNIGKPSSRIFSLQNVAQAMEAIILKNPAKARTSPAALFTNEKDYDSIFANDYQNKVYLNSTLICDHINKLIGTITIDERNTYRNFKFHLARIFTVFLIDKVDYSHKDLEGDIELSSTDDLFEKSLNKLNEFLEIYQLENPEINIINISKSKSFADYISDKLSL